MKKLIFKTIGLKTIGTIAIILGVVLYTNLLGLDVIKQKPILGIIGFWLTLLSCLCAVYVVTITYVKSKGIIFTIFGLVIILAIAWIAYPFDWVTNKQNTSDMTAQQKLAAETKQKIQDSIKLVRNVAKTTSTSNAKNEIFLKTLAENDSLRQVLCNVKDSANSAIDYANTLAQQIANGYTNKTNCNVELKKKMVFSGSTKLNPNTGAKAKSEWMASAKTTETNGKSWMQSSADDKN